MGLFDFFKKKKKRNDDSKKKRNDDDDGYDFDELMLMLKNGKVPNREVIDLRSDKEKQMEVTATMPLSNKTYEKYAIDIAGIYLEKGPTLEDKEVKVRDIGKAINNFDEMLLIAYRAININNRNGGDLCIRHFQYAWQGIAGWIT